jgi:hypothetical protein
MKVSSPLVVHLPDTRGVVLSPFGHGNLKIGPGVFTYSKLPGSPTEPPIGLAARTLPDLMRDEGLRGTCPGSTPECRAICYAVRPVAEQGPVFDMWRGNTITGDDVPEIPASAVLLRAHISGDFDTRAYIENWTARLKARPEVTFWAYTKSWRVPELRPALERLRALPNVQLFASMDPSAKDDPNLEPCCAVCGGPASDPFHDVRCPDDAGYHDFRHATPWRRAWIWRTFDKAVEGPFGMEHRLVSQPGAEPLVVDGENMGITHNHVVIADMTPSYVCPEETGRKKNCVECGYCFEGQKHDVTFLEH